MILKRWAESSWWHYRLRRWMQMMLHPCPRMRMDWMRSKLAAPRQEMVLMRVERPRCSGKYQSRQSESFEVLDAPAETNQTSV